MPAMENEREKKLQKEVFEAIKGAGEPEQLLNYKDASAYQLLFNVLAEKDDIQIPEDFADTVTKKALKRKKMSILFHSVLLYTLPTILLIALSFASLFFLSKEVLIEVISFVTVYHKTIIFVAVIITLVQLADRWLLPKNSGYSTN